MKTFTAKQYETIKTNLAAFVFNFGPVRIEKQDPCCPGYYVYSPADSDSYVQYCYDIDYLNGWLYGAVQAVNTLKRINNLQEAV